VGEEGVQPEPEPAALMLVVPRQLLTAPSLVTAGPRQATPMGVMVRRLTRMPESAGPMRSVLTGHHTAHSMVSVVKRPNSALVDRAK
jgi:hypothetical protein